MDRRGFLKAVGGSAMMAASGPVAVLAQSQPKLLLNQNENPLGMSPKAWAAAENSLAMGHLYPDPVVDVLARTIRYREGLEAGQVTIANGSTDILDATMRAMAARGATLVDPVITFGQGKRFAGRYGMKRVSVPMGVDFAIDLVALERATLQVDGPVVVYLVSPNNPTGRLSDSAAIHAWVKRAPDNVFFLMDEAYHEYVDDPDYLSAAGLVKEGYDNLIVARTFSKIYGMAGLRVGYGLGAPSVIYELQQQYSSWSISVTGVEAALAALEDEDFISKSLEENRQARAVVVTVLDDLGLAHIPSQANFMLHEIPVDLVDYQAAMRRENILVGRDMGQGARWNRLSMGTAAQMERFASVLKSL